MKYTRLYAIAAALSLSISLLPLQAKQTAENPDVQISPVSDTLDRSQINPDYLEWLDDPKGDQPSIFSHSYLMESYARLLGRQKSRRRISEELPKTYDMRDEGKALQIVDQSPYGICWAVSAVQSAAESISDQEPGLSLSPMHLAWFTRTGIEEEASVQSPNPYDAGGLQVEAAASMAAWKGPVLDEKFPIIEGNPEPDESMRFEADYHLQDAFYLPGGIYLDTDVSRQVSQEAMKRIVMEYGPAVISCHASSQAEYFNEETSAWYNANPELQLDHGVQVIGWDDNYSKENFNEGAQPENDGAWLIRNSWGMDWGDGGYFWLSYEDPTMSEGCVYILEEKDNYTNNYQYDTLGWSFVTATGQGESALTGSAANIFTVQDNEQLEAVSFYTTEAGASYTISIYTDVTEGEPTGGTLAGTQSGTELYPGYHTIELNKPVALKKGSRFSIVVETRNPQYPGPIAIELYPCFNPETDLVEELGTGGESYVCMQDEGTWQDIAGFMEGEPFYVTNVCIKGFTNPLPEDGKALSTVRFSEMEGEVDDHTPLTLSAEGGEAIEYSIDGSDFIPYTSAIELQFENPEQTHTIAAYTVDEEGNQGNTVSRTYSKAHALLYSVLTKGNGDSISLDLSSDDQVIDLYSTEEAFSIQAISPDTVTVNGKELEPRAWSEPISIDEGESRTVEVTASAPGKESATCTFTVRRSPLCIDFENETLSFDSAFTVYDPDGNPMTNGQSITDFISPDHEVDLKVVHTDEDGKRVEETYSIPARRRPPDVTIDYVNETTEQIFTEHYLYGFKEDLSDAKRTVRGQSIELTPGKDLYMKRVATEHDFCTEIFKVEVPDRPAAPELLIEELTSSTVVFAELPSACFALVPNDEEGNPQQPSVEDLVDYGQFGGLEADTDYTAYAFISASADHFRSGLAFRTVHTNPDVDLLDVVYRKSTALDASFFSMQNVEAFEEALDQATEILIAREQHTAKEAMDCAIRLNASLLALRLESSAELLSWLEDRICPFEFY